MEKPFPAYKGDEPYVFVCYAHTDADIVYPEIAWLHDQGFNVWYDEGISPGTVWRDELADSIAGAKLVLFFVSPLSVDSINCQREVSYGVDHDTPVLAVHLEQTDLSSGMDLTLSTVQAILKSEMPKQDYRIKLLLGVSERITRGVAVVGPAPRAATGKSATGLKLASVAAIAVLGGVIIGWLASAGGISSNTKAAPKVVRAELNLAPGQNLSAFGPIPFAFSPDGSRVAFSAAPSESLNPSDVRLYIRDLETGVSTSFPEAAGAAQPFFSPDGNWVGFIATDAIKKVSASGGVPITVVTLPRGGFVRGATWTRDDRIVFGGGDPPGLQWVAASGSAPAALTKPAPGETHRMPHALPTGDILFTSVAGEARNARHLSIETGIVRPVDAPGERVFYLPSGYLLWSITTSGISGTRLMAARFDPDTLELGRATSVVDQVQSSGADGIAYYSVSETGSLVFMPDIGPQLLAHMVLVADGVSEPLSDGRIFHYPRLSPDERWIAVSIHETNTTQHDLFLYEVGRDTGTRFTSGVNGHLPLWTPDGKRITFAHVGETEADFDIYWKGIDDEGNGEPLLRAEGHQLPRSWSPDGKQLLYETQSVESGDDLWVLPLGEEPFPFVNTAANERSGVFSPNGKFIAYVSDAADGNQIYVRPYPGPGRARRVSFEGGVEPFWPADSDKLIYRGANRKDMMSVAIKTSSDGEIVELGEPNVVFSGSYTSYLLGGPNYSVSADGKRFLMLETADRGNTDTQLKLVLNWTEELERLVPKD